MLTKHKDLRSKKRRKKPFEKCFYVWGIFRHFFREGTPKFDIFSSIIFFSRVILKHIENKKGSRRVRGHAPQKIFGNLHAVGAILVLFEQFLGKVCSNFWPLNLECFTKYDLFCSYIFDYKCVLRA